MSPRVWIQAVSLVALTTSVAPPAAAFVQDRAPRGARHATNVEETCETWHGDIEGNDPTARIVVELCTRGGRVRGTFFWSSGVSGWDRRAMEGEWREDGAVLAARDTAMLEAHPLHGWTLCTSDAYTLRRTSDDRLEGSYTSTRCHDRGRLAMTRHAPERAAKKDAVSKAHAAAPSVPPLTAQGARTVARCSATPGMGTGRGGLALLLAALAMACARRDQSGDA